MKKRGQVTIFAIIGILIVIIFGLVFYLKAQVAASGLEKEKNTVSEVQLDINFLKTYLESCLTKASRNTIWLTGYQGGYIDIEEDFVEEGGYKIPYYIEEGDTKVTELDIIAAEISSEITVNFRDCIDLDMLSNKGFEVELPPPETETETKVSINDEDITIQLDYPIKISKQDSKISLDNFFVTIPVRLRPIHENIQPLLNKMLNDHAEKGHFCTEDVKSYALDTDMNVVLNNNIIKFIDYKTFYYWNSYIFQFAVRNVHFMDCKD